MKYFVEPEKSCITVIAKDDKSKIFIDQGVISISRFLEVLIENAVEPCHVQNVYDDIVSR